MLTDIEKDTVDFFASIFGTKVTKKDVYSYDTRISQPRGRTEKQDEEFIIHPNYLRGMKRGEAVCRIVYVSGPKVFKMKLKEVKPPPREFDYVGCVPIRDNHLKANQYNKIVLPKAETQSKTSPKKEEAKTPIKEKVKVEPMPDTEILSKGEGYSKKIKKEEVH